MRMMFVTIVVTLATMTASLAKGLLPSQLTLANAFKHFKIALGATRIKLIVQFMAIFMLFLHFSTAHAQNAWSNYRGVEKKPLHPIERPIQQPFAQRDGQHSYRAYSRHQPAQARHDRAQQGGVQIILNQSFPTQTQHYASRRAFVNGQYLPELYRDPQYHIHNWSAQRLPQPLYGQYWVLVDGYYLLIKADNFQIEFVQSL